MTDLFLLSVAQMRRSEGYFRIRHRPSTPENGRGLHCLCSHGSNACLHIAWPEGSCLTVHNKVGALFFRPIDAFRARDAVSAMPRMSLGSVTPEALA